MVEKFIQGAQAIFENLKTKFAHIEKKDVTLVVSKEAKPENLEGLTQYCSLTILRAIEAFHHGFFFYFFSSRQKKSLTNHFFLIDCRYNFLGAKKKSCLIDVASSF